MVCRPRHLDPGSPLSSALLFIASLDAWESLPARSWGRLRTLSATRGKLGDRDERRRFHAPVRLRLAKIIEEKEYPEWLLPPRQPTEHVELEQSDVEASGDGFSWRRFSGGLSKMSRGKFYAINNMKSAAAVVT